MRLHRLPIIGILSVLMVLFTLAEINAGGINIVCPEDDDRQKCLLESSEGLVEIGLNKHAQIATVKRDDPNTGSSPGSSPLDIGIKFLRSDDGDYKISDLTADGEYESTINQSISEGGLGALAAGLLRIPPPQGDDDPFTNMKLEWNKMEVDLDETHSSAVLEVTTVKTLEVRSADGSLISSKKYIYFWIVTVSRGGLYHTQIPQGQPHENWYRYFARGEDIEVISFAAGEGDNVNDLRPVTYFDGNGNINELARVFYHSNNDCLEILVKDKLQDGGTYGNPGGGDVRLCGGSCSGYLLAATNS